jgi:hypothetical protein
MSTDSTNNESSSSSSSSSSSISLTDTDDDNEYDKPCKVVVIFYTPDAEMKESDPYVQSMPYRIQLSREISNKMNQINSTYETKTLVWNELEQTLGLSDDRYEGYIDDEVSFDYDYSEDNHVGSSSSNNKTPTSLCGTFATTGCSLLSVVSCGAYESKTNDENVLLNDDHKKDDTKDFDSKESWEGSPYDSYNPYYVAPGYYESNDHNEGYNRHSVSLDLVTTGFHSMATTMTTTTTTCERFPALMLPDGEGSPNSERTEEELKRTWNRDETEARVAYEVGGTVIKWTAEDCIYRRPYFSHVEMVMGTDTYTIRWNEPLTKYLKKKYLSKHSVYSCLQLNLRAKAFARLRNFCETALRENWQFNYSGLYFNFLTPAAMRRWWCQNGRSYWQREKVYCSEFLARAFCYTGIFEDVCGIWTGDQEKKKNDNENQKDKDDLIECGKKTDFVPLESLDPYVGEEGTVLTDPATTSPNLLHTLLSIKMYACRQGLDPTKVFCGPKHQQVMECMVPIFNQRDLNVDREVAIEFDNDVSPK